VSWKSSVFFGCVSAIVLSVFSASASANLLLNPSFESGSWFPDHWIAWGDGTFVWQTGGAHSGDKCMNLGGLSFALMYQRVPGTPETHYTVRAWAKAFTTDATGTLKVEFHDAGENVIQQFPITFVAPADWTEFSVTNVAPAGTALVTATIVGEAGGMVLFDDVSLTLEDGSPGIVSFDVNDTAQPFEGFGAQIWGYGPDENFPNLAVYREQALEELNIKYVRIENYAESATWTDMQNTRAMTEALGIRWVYMIWVAPWFVMDGNGRLRDDRIDDFANWWAGHVDELYDYGIEVEFIELMNEPDSGGQWSTGITPAQYNTLVQLTRAALDAHDGSGGTNDLTNVGIVGPGLASMDSSASYIYALDSDGVAAMGVWSTHSWGSVDSCGGRCIPYHWPNFGDPADGQNPALSKFVTEYATHETTFHGVTYPHCDHYGEWDESNVFPYYSVSNTMPYAVRVYENTLGLLNSGANVPFIWQAIDEPTEVNPPGYSGSKRKSWGLLDLWGNPKPAYDALKTLYPEIPVGASVVQASAQDSTLYSGALIKDGRLVVGMANGSTLECSAAVQISSAVNLEIVEAVAFVIDHVGGPEIGDPDTGQTIYRELTVNPDHSIDVVLPGDSTLTIICDVALIAGDLDYDCDVDLSDLAELLGHYGTTSGATYGDGDLDGNGAVDLSDLAELLGHYGEVCP